MKTTPLQVGCAAWYEMRAEQTQHNGKTVSQHNYFLAMAEERRVIEVLLTANENLRMKLEKALIRIEDNQSQ
jgi:hypothetical protein